MKPLLLSLTVILIATGCANDISSVGVGGTYTDPETGATYGGTVNVGLRDRSKTIVKPKSAMNDDNKPKFWPSLGRGLARMADGPKPDPTVPSLEQIFFKP